MVCRTDPTTTRGCYGKFFDPKRAPCTKVPHEKLSRVSKNRKDDHEKWVVLSSSVESLPEVQSTVELCGEIACHCTIDKVEIWVFK